MKSLIDVLNLSFFSTYLSIYSFIIHCFLHLFQFKVISKMEMKKLQQIHQENETRKLDEYNAQRERRKQKHDINAQQQKEKIVKEQKAKINSAQNDADKKMSNHNQNSRAYSEENAEKKDGRKSEENEEPATARTLDSADEPPHGTTVSVIF